MEKIDSSITQTFDPYSGGELMQIRHLSPIIFFNSAINSLVKIKIAANHRQIFSSRAQLMQGDKNHTL